MEGTNKDKVNKVKNTNETGKDSNMRKCTKKSNRKKENRHNNKLKNNTDSRNTENKKVNNNKNGKNGKSAYSKQKINENKKKEDTKNNKNSQYKENQDKENRDKSNQYNDKNAKEKSRNSGKINTKESNKSSEINTKGIIKSCKKNKNKKRNKDDGGNNRALFIFCSIIFLTGVCVLMYPFVSNMVNKRNATQAIDNYEKKMENMDKEEIDVIKEAAKKYNEQLNNAVTADDEKADNVTYKDISGIEKVIGYIVIPKIDLNLPIYSGTSQAVLKKGVGHMEQTSYPLGGESTHCVLTGHRGLPNAVLFTDLDEVEIGDEFYLHVLDEVLAYKVDKIKVVEPNESGDLDIVQGEDYCTLVTCTPYAVNTHRLLVRGTRVEYVESAQNAGEGGTQIQSGAFTKRIVDVWPWLLIAFVVIAGVETLFFVMILRRRKRENDE